MSEDPEAYELADADTSDEVLTGLPGQQVVADHADDLIDKVARDLINFCSRRLSAAGVVHLALSGGSTPKALYQRLMVDPSLRHFPWEATHLWVVDDRCVEAHDERFNFKMIRELIVDQCDIPQTHVHPMPVLEAAGDALYEQELRRWLGEPRVGGRLDYVLLGMGSDTHTASLFPRTPAVVQSQRWVVFNDGQTVAAPRPRMTMTLPLINAARRIAVLVTGESKHPALLRVSQACAQSRPDVSQTPIAGVRPVHPDGELTWFLDKPAARGR